MTIDVSHVEIVANTVGTAFFLPLEKDFLSVNVMDLLIVNSQSMSSGL